MPWWQTVVIPLVQSHCWSIILHNRTKHHVGFCKKVWLFSILDFGLKRQKKKTKRASRDPHEGNKFYILDETEHNPKNFGIFVFHHSKVVYILHFVFYGELNTPKI
jgi:hypothetical protein